MNQEIISAFDYLKKNEPDMKPGQISFIGSLKKYFNKNKRLSNGQESILFEIKNYVERSVKNK